MKLEPELPADVVQLLRLSDAEVASRVRGFGFDPDEVVARLSLVAEAAIHERRQGLGSARAGMAARSSASTGRWLPAALVCGFAMAAALAMIVIRHSDTALLNVEVSKRMPRLELPIQQTQGGPVSTLAGGAVHMGTHSADSAIDATAFLVPASLTQVASYEERAAFPETFGNDSASEHVVFVRKGDTFSAMLAKREVAAAERRRWEQAAAAVYDLDLIQPGHRISFQIDPSSRGINAIRYEIDAVEHLVLELTSTGIRARRDALPYVRLLHTEPGDTLDKILARGGIEKHTAHRRWTAAASQTVELRNIVPRRPVLLEYSRSSNDLRSIRYGTRHRESVVLEVAANGVVVRAEQQLPYFVEIKGIAGSIEGDLTDDAVRAGVPASVVNDLVDVFGWDLDLEGGLEAGDEFRVMYENIWEVGDPKAVAGKLLGAEIITGEKTLTAIFFENADGRGTYYRPDGVALSRTRLRYPVPFTEITSMYHQKDRHPILQRRAPNRGVDFGAERGTPVRAVADGVVTDSGWNGGLGKSITIKHGGSLDSRYGHLSEIAPGTKEGVVVTQGQIIGYVGSTGLATGPHLHFELVENGSFVNPTLAPPLEPRLPSGARVAFEHVAGAVADKLAALAIDAPATRLALSSDLFRETN